MKINWKFVFKAFMWYLGFYGLALATSLFGILIGGVSFYPTFYICILTATFLSPFGFALILYWIKDEL